jgi:hypothetical protein
MSNFQYLTKNFNFNKIRSGLQAFSTEAKASVPKKRGLPRFSTEAKASVPKSVSFQK